MALPVYKIGDHAFTFLSAPPEKPVQMCEVMARPGVSGVGVYRMGVRGRPIMLRSEVDLSDKAAALAQLDEYQASIAQDPVDVIWADKEAFSVRQFKVIVLDVRMAHVPMSYPICVGGLNVNDGSPGVWLACDWDLISLETES